MSGEQSTAIESRPNTNISNVEFNDASWEVITEAQRSIVGEAAVGRFFETADYANSRDLDRHWQEFGLCAQTDPELFFPESGESTKLARSVCAACDVREQCLEYAIKNDEKDGIWGGLNPTERKRLTRTR